MTYANETENCRMPDIAALPTSDSSIKFFLAFQRPLNGDYGVFGKLINEDGSIDSETFVAYTPGKDQLMPAVAASENRKEYFISWYTEDASKPTKIEGIRFNAAGTQQSGPMPISEKEGEFPKVIAGPAGDFLVIWEAIPVVLADRDVYGQIIGNRIYLPLIIG
jgi:hypothetical protein